MEIPTRARSNPANFLTHDDEWIFTLFTLFAARQLGLFAAATGLMLPVQGRRSRSRSDAAGAGISRGISADPELVEQDAPDRVVLVVARPGGGEVGDAQAGEGYP